MKLLANENIPLASVLYLKGKGFDIRAIGSDDPGISDQQIIQLAIREQRTIVTFDRDYGKLIFRFSQKPSAGVI